MRVLRILIKIDELKEKMSKVVGKNVESVKLRVNARKTENGYDKVYIFPFEFEAVKDKPFSKNDVIKMVKLLRNDVVEALLKLNFKVKLEDVPGENIILDSISYVYCSLYDEKENRYFGSIKAPFNWNLHSDFEELENIILLDEIGERVYEKLENAGIKVWSLLRSLKK